MLRPRRSRSRLSCRRARCWPCAIWSTRSTFAPDTIESVNQFSLRLRTKTDDDRIREALAQPEKTQILIEMAAAITAVGQLAESEEASAEEVDDEA